MFVSIIIAGKYKITIEKRIPYETLKKYITLYTFPEPLCKNNKAKEHVSRDFHSLIFEINC